MGRTDRVPSDSNPLTIPVPLVPPVPYLAGLVAQSVMSVSDRLGHQDVGGLSATDPHLRLWISIRTMPKDVGMLLQLVLVTAPTQVCAWG